MAAGWTEGTPTAPCNAKGRRMPLHIPIPDRTLDQWTVHLQSADLPRFPASWIITSSESSPQPHPRVIYLTPASRSKTIVDTYDDLKPHTAEWDRALPSNAMEIAMADQDRLASELENDIVQQLPTVLLSAL